MPKLWGGPLKGINAPLREPYKSHYEYRDENGKYRGAYVLVSLQQKSRVTRRFVWVENYNRGEDEQRERAKRAGGRFARFRKGILHLDV